MRAQCLRILTFASAIALGRTQTGTGTVHALSEIEWTLSNDPLAISVPGYVPSQVHLDLYSAQVIGNPYYANNDQNLEWIAKQNWTYASVPITGLSNSTNTSTYLVFEGLDTFASITFCNKTVGSADNQFRQWIYDVSSIYEACAPENVTVSIDFTSAATMAAYLAQLPSESCLLCAAATIFEIPDRQWIRKEQSDFGWDWAPSFAPSGIWQPAYVVQLPEKGVYVTNTMIDIYRRGQLNNIIPDQTQPWVINATIDFIGTLPSGSSISITLVDASNTTFLSGLLANCTSNSAAINGIISGSMLVDESLVPELWWPVGYGNQTLYNMTIEVVEEKSILATVQKRVGFRTIVLNQEPISKEQLSQGIAPGANWNFQINGHEIFCKGSNFVPPDAFWPRVTEEKMKQLFESVVDGNQNMLRIWASGAYLPDFMYDMADEMGILMWSEIEFSDAVTPVSPDFVANSAAEAVYQIRRINHHPSLAVWVGSNEMELILAGIGAAVPAILPAATAQYEYMYLDVLLHAVYDNTRSISYSPSSVSNGYLSLNHSAPRPMVERYNNGTPGAIYGDTDYYNYDVLQSFNLSTYPVGRFAVEFGMVSMPSLQSWENVLPTKPDMFQFNSSIIVSRNHHFPGIGSLTLPTDIVNQSLAGIGEMSIASERYYPYTNKKDSIANFSSQCHTSQIFQAEFMKSEIQFYRAGSGLPQRTLGALYWMLNDIWQSVSFGGLEYEGRWKVLHYVAKDIYQPVVIAPFFNATTGKAVVYVISDLWSTVEGIASLTWYDYTGRFLLVSSVEGGAGGIVNVSVGAINATKVFEFDTSELSFPLNDAIGILEVTVEGEPPNSPNGKQTYTHTNWITPVHLSEAKLVDPELSLDYNKTSGKFIVESKAVAAWVWLDHPAGVVGNFEDNGFTLLPGLENKREVGFRVKSDATKGGWVDEVTVSSIWNNTLV